MALNIPFLRATLMGLMAPILFWSAAVAQTPRSPAEEVPLLIYTDILSGPNSGGEDNKGIYLSVFGKNFGGSGLGTTTKVYIGDIEVDNYRYLGPSRGRQDIQQITVQVGALGKPIPGVALPIKVVVDGMASNNPKNLAFTVNPGIIYFVDPVAGVDTATITTGGTYSAPFKTVQNPAGMSLAFAITPASMTGAYGRVRAGDFIVLRGGRYTNVGFCGRGCPDGTGYFMQTLNKSGCPLGNPCAQGGGASSGPITVMGYPGEDAFIDRSNNLGDAKAGGGISSTDRARQQQGYGAWWTITNLKIESGFNDGPINVQNGTWNPNGSHWRVVNNELMGLSCRINTKCRAGGIAGAGAGSYWVGNHIHDMHDKLDDVTDLENHGIYIGGDGSYEIAYNRIENIPGGNGVQTHGGNPNINNVSIHHNIIRNVGKHGINLADGSQNNIVIWNNLVFNTVFAGLRMGGTSTIQKLKVYNNSFYNTGIGGDTPSSGALTNDMMPAPNQVDIRNNIFWPHSGSRYHTGKNNPEFKGAIGTISNNLWFNGKGSILGSSNVTANPRFVSIAPGAENFRLQAGSPAVDAGSGAALRLVVDDFDATTSRPLGRKIDIGAYEFGN